jgi:serine/threonine-protein kinase RsbW
MRAVEEFREFGRGCGLGESELFGPLLALEECGSNIVDHAFHRDATQIFTITIECDDHLLAIELRDRGPEFDPTAPSAREPQPADDDQLGGWGLQLVRRYMDTIRYRREGQENILNLTRKRSAASSPE